MKGWVVERNNGFLRQQEWFTIEGITVSVLEADWTPDIHSALYFARREDAELLQKIVKDGQPKMYETQTFAVHQTPVQISTEVTGEVTEFHFQCTRDERHQFSVLAKDTECEVAEGPRCVFLGCPGYGNLLGSNPAEVSKNAADLLNN